MSRRRIRFGRRARAIAVGAGVGLALLALTGCAGVPGSAPTPTNHRTRVTVIGDSIVAGWALRPAQAWPALVGEDRDVAITNLGCPGGGFLKTGRCGMRFDGLIAGAVAADPEVVIVQSSRNDQHHGDAELRAATARCIDELHRRIPSARIIGVSTLWNDQAVHPREVEVSSAALKAAVEAVGGEYVDVGQPLLGHPEWMQPDTIHPTAAGQRAIADAVDAVLPPLG